MLEVLVNDRNKVFRVSESISGEISVVTPTRDAPQGATT